ncbi:GNAT family N-acetyltransferase [Pseudoalteromonas obscura]|uniref:GNAT family N-acetyltransferase n=1 Tax=Pseudoalteromonas obscura TaxID=3048491 RepID=A0ABT7EN95_9GAMM|nr:GNAT family N-acetyltransferase [Pseudoalteromonas sp. P94(2023)]MDK2596521.1 GNAT family N-acetyltransferase [Pseudoalteromonas sp. P94(2023)]
MKVNQSNRLKYRLLTPADSHLLFKLDQDPKVMQFINGGKVTSQEDIDTIFIPRLNQFTNAEKGWGLWGCFLTDNNEFIGWILVRPMDFFTEQRDDSNLEIGWRFMQSSWGRGYATEAAMQIAGALTEHHCANKLTAIALEDNSGSINIMKKIGLEYVTTTVHSDPLGSAEVVVYEKSLIT